MKQSLSHETYPLYSLEVNKSDCPDNDLASIITRIKGMIEAHEMASFIEIIDHIEYIQQIPHAAVSENIINAKSILFCFGLTLPSPQVTATNPRSMGVVELDDSFVITFLQTPMPVVNTTMEKWAERSFQQN